MEAKILSHKIVNELVSKTGSVNYFKEGFFLLLFKVSLLF